MKSEAFKITAGYILICLIWGSTWLAIKLGLDSFTPLAAAGFRFTTAALLFYIIIRFKKIEIKMDRPAIRIYLMLGFLSYVIPFSLVYWAEQYVSTGLTSILFGVLPFFVVIISRIVMPENKIGFYQLAGIILGFAGLVIIFSANLQVDFKNDFWGMLAVFGSAILQAFIAVMMKKHSHNLHPLALNYIPTLIAGPVLIIAGFLFENHSTWNFNLNGIFSFFYLAIVGTIIAFSIYYWLMKKIDVLLLSLNSFITPIIAIILGCVILSETFTLRDFIGSSFVLIGVLFANLNGLINYFNKKRPNTKI